MGLAQPVVLGRRRSVDGSGAERVATLVWGLPHRLRLVLPPCLPPVQVCVYDPQVEDGQIYQDLGTEKFEWDHPSPRSRPVPKTAIDIASVSRLSKSSGMLQTPGQVQQASTSG